MRRPALPFITLLLLSGCGGCDQEFYEESHSSDVRAEFDATFGDVGDIDRPSTDRDAAVDSEIDLTDDDPGDLGFDTAHQADAGRDDDAALEDATPLPVCGDGITEGAEACDDGNTSDGDYCSADCSQITGSCGDGVVQTNETCDDQMTTDCTGTHDGGDGACVPMGTCSTGYSLDGGGVCVPTNTTGLPTPCSNGTGQTLFRFHYDSGSTSARIDVWDASCSYSFAPNSACNVREVYPGFGEVSRTSEGYPILTSSEYIRVRFSVAGINFNQATLYVRARSYATSSSTDIEAWSPLYGSAYFGPVDNDFVYDWYAVDWSNYLFPSDDPNLTAIQLYAYQGSNSLAVRAVEVCLE